MVSECVKKGETLLFDAAILLQANMAVRLIRTDINGSVDVATTGSTEIDMVRLVYAETVAEDSKFTVEV